MKRAMKILALLLVCLIVVSVTACGKGNDASTSNSPSNNASTSGTSSPDSNTNSSSSSGKDTLVIATTSDRGTLDPVYARGGDVNNALGNIYETLWIFDSDGNRVWKLATGLDIIEPTKWIVHVREGVKFSNGNDFDAEDVLFSLWRATRREGHPNDCQYLDYENCKVIDKYTIEINFTQHNIGHEISFAGYSGLGMFDKDSYDEEHIPLNPMGTGPYYLDDYVVNGHVYLEARDDYWGDAPHIKHLKFMMVAEDAQRVNSLQTGAVDICPAPFQDVAYIQDSIPGYSVDIISGTLSQALYMSLNPASIFYNNIDARKAVALCINKQGLVNIAYSGYASASRLPASMGIADVDPAMVDYGIYGLGYNLELAKELAEKSGIVGKDALLINNGGSADRVMCELIQEACREIGLNVTVQSLDQGSWLPTIFSPESYDMCIDMVSGNTVAGAIYGWARIGTGGSPYDDEYADKERFVELLDKVMMVSDPAQLREMSIELVKLHTDSFFKWFALVDAQSATAYSDNLNVVRDYYNTILWDKCSWK